MSKRESAYFGCDPQDEDYNYDEDCGYDYSEDEDESEMFISDENLFL